MTASCLVLMVILTIGLLAAPLATDAQQPATIRPRIGWLDPGFPAPSSSVELKAFRDGLRKLGYIEGQSVVIEPRWAEERVERFGSLAEELVRSRVDVLVTRGIVAARAAKQASTTIPIVSVGGFDPVQAGLVASLARPGGNITGLTLPTELGPKRLELLKEAMPTLSRVAVFGSPATGGSPLTRALEEAARALRVHLSVVDLHGGDDLAGAFSRMARERAQAAIITGAIFFDHRQRIADLAMQHRLPTMHEVRDYAEAGCLMSYGQNIASMFQRAATFVDKILKGAKPADLPIEQATKFELVINMRTVKALGLTIPASVLVRAD